jgi:hypothetical protein
LYLECKGVAARAWLRQTERPHLPSPNTHTHTEVQTQSTHTHSTHTHTQSTNTYAHTQGLAMGTDGAGACSNGTDRLGGEAREVLALELFIGVLDKDGIDKRVL